MHCCLSYSLAGSGILCVCGSHSIQRKTLLHMDGLGGGTSGSGVCWDPSGTVFDYSYIFISFIIYFYLLRFLVLCEKNNLKCYTGTGVWGGEKCQKYLFHWYVKNTFNCTVWWPVSHFVCQKLICMSLIHLYVTTSFVCHYFICMSLPHLYVTTSFVCHYHICMSLHLYVTTHFMSLLHLYVTTTFVCGRMKWTRKAETDMEGKFCTRSKFLGQVRSGMTYLKAEEGEPA